MGGGCVIVGRRQGWRKRWPRPRSRSPLSGRNAGMNHNWLSEFTVTWPLGDLQLTRRFVSPPSCSLVVVCGCVLARYCLEGGRACSPGKEEVVEAEPNP